MLLAFVRSAVLFRVVLQGLFGRLPQLATAPPAALRNSVPGTMVGTGKKTRLCAPFYTKNDYFAKTGSGQT
jgi:hypothetical protein